MVSAPSPDDPAFPRLHGRPAAGWLNDPNGCARIDGVFHVFFQHNPDAPRHTAMRWGHIRSADLVHWQQEPVALFNRPGELDEVGCWTGCVIDDGGVPTAVYSAVAEHSGRSEVLLARSDRTLRSWDQGATPVAPMPDDPAITEVRDPFVFWFEGHRYAIQGAGRPGGHGRVIIHGCDDLEAWTSLGTLLTADHPAAAPIAAADIWECPNLFPLGGRWVLVVSLWRLVDGAGSLAGVRYLVGELNATPDGPRFEPESGGELDDGPSFYAPQVLCDDGRVLLWAWSRELGPQHRGRSQQQIDAAGWAGVLTFARELSLVDGQLVSSPVPELAGLRGSPLLVAPGQPFTAAAFEVELGADAGRASLYQLIGADEVLVHEWDVPPQSLVPARILADGSLVEIFDGTGTAFTTRAYPTADSAWIVRCRGAGPPRAWTLRS